MSFMTNPQSLFHNTNSFIMYCLYYASWTSLKYYTSVISCYHSNGSCMYSIFVMFILYLFFTNKYFIQIFNPIRTHIIIFEKSSCLGTKLNHMLCLSLEPSFKNSSMFPFLFSFLSFPSFLFSFLYCFAHQRRMSD